jgi:Polyketide synthase dehydratase/Methyltransferase domain
MLVMAIEAARQMSRSKTDRSVTGYMIKDVTFRKSLSISPDGDGVEVEFHLRPVGKASDREVSWSEFRLYAFENEEWAETCRGSIRLEYEEASTEVDGGLESAEETSFYKRMLHGARASCPKPGNTKNLYETFDKCGLGFGLTFQTLEDGSYNDKGEAIAHINLHQWLLKANKTHQQPSVIHPTALDGLLQLSFLALSQGGEKIIPSLVPTQIQKLWVSNTGLSDQTSSEIIAYNKSAFLGFREAESTVFAMDASESKLKVVIEGYGKVALGNKSTASATTSTPRRLCFNVDQRPDLELLDQNSFVAYTQSIFPTVPSPLDFFRDMKTTMCLSLLKTLEKLSSVDIKTLKPHHRKYLRWMKLESEKLHVSELCHGDLEWRKYLNDDHYFEDLCDRLEKTNKTGRFHVEVCRNLYKILCGSVDPLGLFFRTDLVKDYYREFNKTTNGLNSFLIYLDAMAHKRPDIKILEIGAGTGGVAGHVLQTLTRYGEHESRVPRFAHYAYTDISPSFFEAAQSMFEDFPDRVTFKTLDIEKDPTHQGFEEEAYDLVIADNVSSAILPFLSSTICGI